MKRYAARRDENEPQIIAALRSAGYAVEQLESPRPDLLVASATEIWLLEVKGHDPDQRARPHRGKGNTLDGPMAALTPSQVRWWQAWRGKPPVIVHDAAEALAAVGATR